ncbi:MAG: hypothetical protein JWP92_3554 [Caulobacter sp.]|nr:hypothetical protein [Caulobacter sp.]
MTTKLLTTTALAAVLAGGLAGPALAQLSPAAMGQLNAIQQQQDLARFDALASQAELRASQDRLRTTQTLGTLNAGRAAPLPPLATTPLPPLAANPAADNLGGEMDRLNRATDGILAQSNARVRAIKPASGN